MGVERRERILDAATRRFTTSGYSQTSLADIARDVGVTSPGVTHHFPTKQHILLAITERRFDVLNELAESQPPAGDGTGTLRMMLALTTRLVSEPGLMELFVRVSAEAADPHSAAVLDVPRHAPLLMVERLTHLEDGRPVDFEFIRFRGDRLTLHGSTSRRPRETR